MWTDIHEMFNGSSGDGFIMENGDVDDDDDDSVSGQSGTGTGFSPNSSIFPFQYHSTAIPYSFIIWVTDNGLWILY
jgi:hypothetical protein